MRKLLNTLKKISLEKVSFLILDVFLLGYFYFKTSKETHFEYVMSPSIESFSSNFFEQKTGVIIHGEGYLKTFMILVFINVVFILFILFKFTLQKIRSNRGVKSE